MSLIDLVILVAVGLLVGISAGVWYRKRKKGGSCGNCGCCPMAGKCAERKPASKEEN